MFKIDGTNITLTQGNTADIQIIPLDDVGQMVYLVPGDRIVFAIKSLNKYHFRKELTDADYDSDSDSYLLRLEPEDTEDLPPLAYKYDCLLITRDGEQYTFIDESNFTLVRAIAKAGDDE